MNPPRSTHDDGWFRIQSEFSGALGRASVIRVIIFEGFGAFVMLLPVRGLTCSLKANGHDNAKRPKQPNPDQTPSAAANHSKSIPQSSQIPSNALVSIRRDGRGSRND